MASEPGVIAACFGRSLERKKKADESERTLQRQNSTNSQQGRKQQGRNVTGPKQYNPDKGACAAVFIGGLTG